MLLNLEQLCQAYQASAPAQELVSPGSPHLERHANHRALFPPHPARSAEPLRTSPTTMHSTPAFTAPAALGARALAGAALSTPTCAPSAGPTMALTRRAALGAALSAVGAAMLPASAFAKGGDAPKISIFGVGGASSPFESGIQKGGTVLYERFSEDEMAYFKSILDASSDRFVQAKASIDIKSWEDIRSLIRLETTLLRTTMVKVAESLDKDGQKKATAIYDGFKKDLNDLDYACSTKNQDKAQKSYKAVLRSFASWRAEVGI